VPRAAHRGRGPRSAGRRARPRNGNQPVARVMVAHRHHQGAGGVDVRQCSSSPR
jgi:hypothetical protein